jgi:hypothetical protein
VSFGTVPPGFWIPFSVSLLVSPLRLGTTRSVSSLFGNTSTTLTQYGNYTAYAGLTYYAPRFYFPLKTSLLDFAGQGLTFTNPNAKTYNNISYSANTPIFDEGLVITNNDVANLNISNYTNGTLFLKIKYKGQNTANVRTILKTPNFELRIDNTPPSVWTASTAYSVGAKVSPTTANGYYYECTTAGTSGTTQPSWPTTEGATVQDGTVVWTCRYLGTIKLIQGTNTLSCRFKNLDYVAGSVYLVGIQWTTTSTTLAVAKWNNGFDTATKQTATGSWTITFRTTYLGSTGTANFLGDAISDFVLYDYVISNWTTQVYNFTTNPLRWNNLYIANKTPGKITYQDGILTDENGNDITGLVSGQPIELPPATETTIEMLDGLSGKWDVFTNDTFYP